MRKNKSFKWIRPLYSTVLIVVVLSLTGCWSANETNNLGIINVLGIDENDAGQVEVTAVIAKPHTLFAETAVAGSQQSKFLIETTTGESIFEAIGHLSSTVSETLYFGHVDAIVFGERAARERMLSSLDFFKRENDFRPNIQLLVTRGPASNLVKTLPQLNVTLGLELEDLVLSNRFAATGMMNDISQFMEALSSNTTDPVTGVISSAKKQGIDIEENGKQTNGQPDTRKKDMKSTERTLEKNQQDIPKALTLKDTAVFKGGQLKGFLDERETRGLLWVKGELQNEIVVLNCGKNNKGTVSLKVTHSESQLSPQLSGKTPRMTVNIQVDADIGQLTCSNINISTRLLDRLNQRLEERITQEASSALNKAKSQWQTDIFGFGQAIYRNDPEEWKQMAPEWRNGLLKNMDVDLRVSANISRYGSLKDPSEANEGE
jgi:spore germination protein KC